MHENETKRMYSKRVTEIEHGTFTPLIFTTTGGMGKECLIYHSRLAELIANKKERLTRRQWHGLERKSPFQSFDWLYYALEVQGQ